VNLFVAIRIAIVIAIVAVWDMPSACCANLKDLHLFSLRVEEGSTHAVFTLENTGQSVITAYSLNFIQDLSNGKHYKFDYSTDLLQLVMNSRERTGDLNSWTGALQPHGVHTESIAISGAPGCDPHSIHAEIEGVIFSDGTVKGSDPERLRLIQQQRRATEQSQGVLLSLLAAENYGDIFPRLDRIIRKIKEQEREARANSVDNAGVSRFDPMVFSTVEQQIAGFRFSRDSEARYKEFFAQLEKEHSLYSAELNAERQR
jgi:hypothetical protein